MMVSAPSAPSYPVPHTFISSGLSHGMNNFLINSYYYMTILYGYDDGPIYGTSADMCMYLYSATNCYMKPFGSALWENLDAQTLYSARI